MNIYEEADKDIQRASELGNAMGLKKQLTEINDGAIKHDGTKETTLALIERRRVLETRAQKYGFKTWWDAQDAYHNHDCDSAQGQGCETCAMWHGIVGIE